MPSWELRDYDREFFEKELASFLPGRIFDAHAHLYELAHSSLAGPLLELGPQRVTLEEYREQMQWLMPGRPPCGLFFGDAMDETTLQASNRFVAAEVAKDGACRGHLVVPPHFEPELVRQEVKRHGFVGLKVYHTFSARKPTWDANLSDYFPGEHARIAGEEGWSVTIHLVKSRALADPVNQQQIKDYSRRYPGLRMILAHAARGFNSFHTIDGVEAMRGLPNVWYDASAITESGALEAIIERLGHDRLLWGSDFPVSHFRGRCVAIGDQFVWLYEDTLDWDKVSGHAQVLPLFIGHESLRALKAAAMRLHLTDSQIEDIFYGNAVRMFGVRSSA